MQCIVSGCPFQVAMLPVPLLLAFGVATLLHCVAINVFPKLGLLDFPERYGFTRRRLPYPTGILSILVFLVFFSFLELPSFQSLGLLLAIVLLATTSFLDDRTPLPPLARLLIHVVVGFIIFATGTRIYTLTNPLEAFTSVPYLKLDTWDIHTSFFGPLPFWSGLFTIFWILLTVNALNWFDGIPGQVSLLCIISFLTIGFLSLSSRVNQPHLAELSFVLAGIAIASFAFDFPPPRVLMGDTGAMFFGLMLGVLTIYAGGKVATAFLVLGVPLIDSFLVLLRRLRKGKNPFEGSLRGEHLHHRLLAKGWTPLQVILLTASLGSAFGLTALFLSTFEKFLAALFLFLIMLMLSWYSRSS